MIRTLTPLFTALLLVTMPVAHAASSAAEAAAPAATAASTDIKVVYHVNDSDNAMAALRNVKNELNASPDTHIVVVTHSKGIDFLLKDAQDKNGNPYEPIVQELKDRGVGFDVCNNTLKSRKLDASAVIPEATIVPSGVAEIARLQAKEGYVYLKP
jgi:intracellular sulfur oxidation DsrE/DsrF family protein